MRLLQLATRPGEILDLHPKVSVVQGLRPEDRHLLLSTVRGLARPDTVHSVPGLLEAHGVLFDLDAALIATLELDCGDVDPVVRQSDLPSQPQTVDARELRQKEKAFAAIIAEVAEKADVETRARAEVQAAAAALTRARADRTEAESGLSTRMTRVDALTAELDRLDAARAQADADVEQAAAARGTAAETLAEVEARTADVRAAVTAARDQRDARRAELDAAVAASDDEATTAVEQALAREAEVAARLAALRAGSLVPEEPSTPELGDSEGATEERIADLERTLLALEDVDTSAVEEALTGIEGRGVEDEEPSAVAGVLADEIEAVLVELGDEPPVAVDPARVETARERLDEARQALIAAEDAVRNPRLDAAGVAAIERAHEELLEAIEKADVRFGGGRARARIESLREQEHEALGALGFHSYTDYVIGNSSRSVDLTAQSDLQAARQELAVAEQAWGEIERSTERALAQAVVLDRRRELGRRAEALLGPPPVPFAQAPAALRQVRVPSPEMAAAGTALRDALGAAGMDVADEVLELEDLAALARAWLDEVAAADDRRAAVQRELAILRGEESQSVDESAPPAASDPSQDAIAATEAELARVREEVIEARARLASHGAAEEERQRLSAAVASADTDFEVARGAASAAEQEYQRALDERDRLAKIADRAAKARAQVETEIAAARDELSELDELSRAGLDQFMTAVNDAEAAHFQARSRLEAATNAVAALNDEGQAIATEIERLQDIVAAGDAGEVTAADELEWYLLARLAAQRSVSLAGSLPILLDDALAGLDADDIDHILERLEPMAEAVQVIVLSDDDAVARWAGSAGPTRAAVVAPVPT